MTTLEKWSLHALTLIVGATGIAYWAMQHLWVTDDPFAVVNHPWQPAMLAAHVLAAPLLILVFGVVYQSHIRPKVPNRAIPNRRSGLLALGTFGIMLLSGYALQVTTGAVLRQAMLVTHLASGVLFLGAYLVHQVISIRLHLALRRRKAGEYAAA